MLPNTKNRNAVLPGKQTDKEVSCYVCEYHSLPTSQNLLLVLGVIIVSMVIAAAPLVKLFTQKERGPAAKAQLFRENSSFLLGRSPGPEYLAQVERLARSVPGVLGVHDLRAEYIGPDTVHAGLHIEVQPGLPIEEAERIAEEVRWQVHQGTDSGFWVIHVEAAQPERIPVTEKSPGTTLGS